MGVDTDSARGIALGVVILYVAHPALQLMSKFNFCHVADLERKAGIFHLHISTYFSWTAVKMFVIFMERTVFEKCLMCRT